MRLRKTPAAIAALGAATALAIAGCSSSSPSATGSTSSSSGAPAQLVVWRMGPSTPAQVTWMNSVTTQFHKDYPAYASTKVLANDTQNGNVYAIPWFGGVRGIWCRTGQFKAAGITGPPTTWAQLITDTAKYTLPIYVTYFYGRGSVDWGSIMASSTLFTIPVMIFFLLVQRRMTTGLVAGAVKG